MKKLLSVIFALTKLIKNPKGFVSRTRDVQCGNVLVVDKPQKQGENMRTGFIKEWVNVSEWTKADFLEAIDDLIERRNNCIGHTMTEMLNDDIETLVRAMDSAGF